MPEVKVVEANEGLATNVEALCMLRERKAATRKVDDFTERAIAYLEGTAAGCQAPDQVSQCVRFMRGLDGGMDLDLTPEQRLQIVNLGPDSTSTVCAICGDDVDDARVDEILKLSKAHLRRSTTTTGATGATAHKTSKITRPHL